MNANYINLLDLDQRLSNFTGLTLMHLNIRSLNKNFDDLIMYINSLQKKPDIIVCTETHKIIAKNFFELEGYHLYTANGETSRNDGTCVYIRDGTTHTYSIIQIGPIKAIFISLQFSSFVLNITSFYRSPSLPIKNFIDNLAKYLSDTQNLKYHIILGDLNIDLLNINNLTDKYLNSFFAFGFKPFIDIPTRVTDHSKTCIDQIFGKIPDDVPILPLVCDLGITDHYTTMINIDSTVISTPEMDPKPANKLNWNRLSNLIGNLEWDDIYREDNVNMAMAKLIENIKHAIEASVLTKTAKENFYNNVINNIANNSKKLWSFINRKIDKINRKKPIKQIKIDPDSDIKITNEKDIANIFNDFFINIGPDMANKIPAITNIINYHIDPNSNPNTIFLRLTCESEVLKIIHSLNSNKSAGIDQISAKVIEHIAVHIAKPLVPIVNKCLETAIFPDHLKKAEVVPIYKSGDDNLPTNFRPISLISNFAKIFEKIIKSRFENFLAVNNIIDPMQFGFQAGKKTEDALSLVTDEIYDAINDNQRCLTIFLDLAKAFDTVNHETLLNKLNSIGLRGEAHDLMKSYISDRKQIVRINKTYSDEKTVLCGVPQGTIIEPLLFVIYINDIFKIMNKKELISFADDTVVIIRGETWLAVLDNAETKINAVAQWLGLNYLNLNIKKTNYITYGCYKNSIPSSCKIQIHKHLCDKNNCDCHALDRVDETKYLGVWLDSNLSWTTHVNCVANKVRYMIYVFYKLQKILNVKQLYIIYHALFWSIVTYGIIVWGGTCDTNLKILHNIHKRILKIIHGKNLYYPSELLFDNHSIPRLRNFFIEKSILKNFGFLQKKYLGNNTFKKRNKNITLPRMNKDLVRHSNFYASYKIFNLLPDDTKLLPPEKLHKQKKIIRNWVSSLTSKAINGIFHPLV